MATRYEIESTQRFTGDGVIGVWLFMCAPIVSGLGWAWYLNEIATVYGRASLVGPSVVIFVGGMAFLAGCAFMLIGRYQVHNVRTIEDKDQWPAGSPQPNQAIGGQKYTQADWK